MSLTVGELSAILKVENRQFEEALKSAKKHLENFRDQFESGDSPRDYLYE